MQKIYVTCSLTHAPEQFRQDIEKLKQMLAEKYEILHFVGLVNGTAQDVFKHDIHNVKTCDLLLSDCSYPAIGLGFEIATALGHKKPVLAVAHQDSKVSRMVLGIDNTLFSFMRYQTLEEVADAVDKKIQGII